MKAAALATAALLSLSGCAVLQPDFTDMRGVTLPAGLLAPDYVPVNAAVFANLADVQRYCSTADKAQTAAKKLGGRYIACAITTPEGKCLLIKWTHTSWELIGHEAGHCLFAARAKAGNLSGIPPHFIPFTPTESPE